MSQRRLLVVSLLGLGLVATGAGVTLGIGRSGKDARPSLRTEAKPTPPKPAAPPPVPPKPLSEREREVASVVDFIQEACDLLKRTDLTAYEVAQRLGRPYGKVEDYVDPDLPPPRSIGFEAKNPHIAPRDKDDSGSEILGDPRAPAISSITLPVRDFEFLPLAALESAFGPAYVYDGWLTFAPQPADTGPVHCQVTAHPYGWVDFDSKTYRVLPLVDTTKVFIEEIDIDRGTLDVNNQLWVGGTRPPPKTLPFPTPFPPPRPRSLGGVR